ncbi:MAG TPA: flagellar FlbD family protein [Acidobacteriaceae bacterium]|jgi:flagellar protein FlbD
MIELTRLNGNPLVVNSDLIKYIESSPDTTITLVTGEKIVVREPCAEVTARFLAHRTKLLGDVAAAQAQGSGAQASAVSANSAYAVSSRSESKTEESNPR